MERPERKRLLLVLVMLACASMAASTAPLAQAKGSGPSTVEPQVRNEARRARLIRADASEDAGAPSASCQLRVRGSVTENKSKQGGKRCGGQISAAAAFQARGYPGFGGDLGELLSAPQTEDDAPPPPPPILK